jgi:1-phosphofructokinase family hexose kinase
MSDDIPTRRPTRVVGVSLNAAVDKTAAVDRLIPGAIHRPRVLSVVPGGKAANVVRAARHLGLAGEVVAVLGGHSGEWYREALAARGIGLHAVDVAGETRTCLSVLDESTGALTEFYEAGVTLAAEEWPRIEARLREALATDGTGALVVLAGSLPPGAPVDAYRRLALVAGAAGARVIVDIDGEPLAAALAARPWLVKVNAQEAASVTGTASRTQEGAAAGARGLRDTGAANAIVTRGVHGAVLVTADGAWALGPMPAGHRGPYSVGSGDAFLAGFLAAVARGRAPAEALRLAGAAGAANAQIPGQGELEPADVDRTLAVCSVTELAPP